MRPRMDVESPSTCPPRSRSSSGAPPLASASETRSSTATTGGRSRRSRPPPSGAARAFIASRPGARRPRRASGPRTSRSGPSPHLAPTPPVVWSCRSTPDSRAARPGTSCGRRAPGCCSPSPTSSTPTISRSSKACDGLDALEHIVVLRGHVPPGADRRGTTFSTRAGAVAPSCDARAGRRARRRRHVRHPLHVGHHRRAEGRDAHPRGEHPRVLELVRRRRPARGRPLSRGQPVLPRLRAQGGHPRLAPARRHGVPARGVRRARR